MEAGSEVVVGINDNARPTTAKKAAAKLFMQVNHKQKIVNLHVKPGNPICEDVLFRENLAQAGYELAIHVSEKHTRPGPAHARACITRTIVVLELSKWLETQEGVLYEVHADPRSKRHVAKMGQISRVNEFAKRYAGAEAPDGFCNCQHWVQCPHKPEKCTVIMKDCAYYGGEREVTALRKLGHRVVVVGWHYKTTAEAYEEVELIPMGDGLYDHRWAGDVESTGFIHALPGDIQVCPDDSGVVVVQAGAYRATVYEPLDKPSECKIDIPAEPTDTVKPHLQSGLTVDGLFAHPVHGPNIRKMYANAVDHDIQHVNNRFNRELSAICERPEAGVHYARALANLMASESRIAASQIGLSQTSDYFAHDASKRNASYEYSGPGFFARLYDWMYRKYFVTNPEDPWSEVRGSLCLAALAVYCFVTFVLVVCGLRSDVGITVVAVPCVLNFALLVLLVVRMGGRR